jgi:hypothetical protein
MPVSESSSLVRRLLRGDLPILPGKNSGRVAPAHILNKFLYRIVGRRGAAHVNLRSMITGQLDAARLADVAESSSDPAVREDLVRSIRAIVNADKRAFKGMASFLPLDQSVIGDDPSDDNYGTAIVELLTSSQREVLLSDLAYALDSSRSPDAISSAVALVTRALAAASLGTTLSPDGDSGGEIPSRDDDEQASSMFGSVVFEILHAGLTPDRFRPDTPYRIKNLQHLSTMLAAIVSLGLLADPITRGTSSGPDRTNGASSMGVVLGILVYTGAPPGPPRDVCVRLAHQSLTDAVQRAYVSIENAFCQLFGGSRWGGNRDWIEARITERGLSGPDAVKLLRTIEDHKTPSEAFRSLVTLDDLRGAVRSLAVKIGLAGPQRGNGEVRLLLETSFLEGLVYFLGMDGMPFEDFVDTCYERLGLIVGKARNLDPAVRERLSKIAGRSIDISEVLESVHSMLRHRMVATGLAQEYSDGFTVVRES